MAELLSGGFKLLFDLEHEEIQIQSKVEQLSLPCQINSHKVFYYNILQAMLGRTAVDLAVMINKSHGQLLKIAGINLGLLFPWETAELLLLSGIWKQYIHLRRSVKYYCLFKGS